MLIDRIDFKKHLHREVPGLQEVSEKENYDVILLFCPVVSHARTDIKGALEKLHNIPVVLHHTFNPDLTVQDSSNAVTREKTLTVDCLFHEDKGLLQCRRNNTAIAQVKTWIESEVFLYLYIHLRPSNFLICCCTDCVGLRLIFHQWSQDTAHKTLLAGYFWLMDYSQSSTTMSCNTCSVVVLQGS
uniref:Uncharacterized protein n=1 Tax=Pygocentrus nattereri TaxID=42514 RepID=A0AAR2L9X3_PYGNA